MVQGFWGKRMPLCGRNWPTSIRRIVSSTRWPNSLRCSSVMVVRKYWTLDQPLADEDNLGDFSDAGHPGIADQLRIEGQQIRPALPDSGWKWSSTPAGSECRPVLRWHRRRRRSHSGQSEACVNLTCWLRRGWRMRTRSSWAKRSSSWMPCCSMRSQVSVRSSRGSCL